MNRKVKSRKLSLDVIFSRLLKQAGAPLRDQRTNAKRKIYIINETWLLNYSILCMFNTFVILHLQVRSCLIYWILLITFLLYFGWTPNSAEQLGWGGNFEWKTLHLFCDYQFLSSESLLLPLFPQRSTNLRNVSEIMLWLHLWNLETLQRAWNVWDLETWKRLWALKRCCHNMVSATFQNFSIPFFDFFFYEMFGCSLLFSTFVPWGSGHSNPTIFSLYPLQSHYDSCLSSGEWLMKLIWCLIIVLLVVELFRYSTIDYRL